MFACGSKNAALQSARGVWRQRSAAPPWSRKSCPLQSARGVWRQSTAARVRTRAHALQSARGVWRQRTHEQFAVDWIAVAICTGRVEAKRQARTGQLICHVAICTGRVEAKHLHKMLLHTVPRCNLHGACGGKGWLLHHRLLCCSLQSARGVWRQRFTFIFDLYLQSVAICTGRVEAKDFITHVIH